MAAAIPAKSHNNGPLLVKRGFQVHEDYLLSLSVNPPSLATMTGGEVTLSFPTGSFNAKTKLLAIPPTNLEAGLHYTEPKVTAADTAKMGIINVSGGTVDGAALTWTFIAIEVEDA